MKRRASSLSHTLRLSRLVDLVFRPTASEEFEILGSNLCEGGDNFLSVGDVLGDAFN